jgi:acetyl esterase/lipase
VSKDLPPVLLVVGERDYPMLAGDARAFTEKAKGVGGSVATYVAAGCDHMGVVRSLVEDRSPAREQVVAFLNGLENQTK